AEAVQDMESRIEIEQRKTSQVAMATTNGLARLKVIDLTRSRLTAYSQSAQFKSTYVCPDGQPAIQSVSSGVIRIPESYWHCPPDDWLPAVDHLELTGSYNPGATAAAQLTGEEREITASQQIQIQDAQSQAAIDDMRLDQAQAQEHERSSEKEY